MTRILDGPPRFVAGGSEGTTGPLTNHVLDLLDISLSEKDLGIG